MKKLIIISAMALLVSCSKDMDCVEETFGYHQMWVNGGNCIFLLEDNMAIVTNIFGTFSCSYGFTPNCDSLGTSAFNVNPSTFVPVEKLDNDHIKFGSAIYTRVQ